MFFFCYLYVFVFALLNLFCLTHWLCFAPIQTPPSNGAAVSEYRLEWGAAEGSMQMCYTGAALSHEMRGLLPATSYFCRVQVRNAIIHTLISSQCLSWWWDVICETNQEIAVRWLIMLLLPVSTNKSAWFIQMRWWGECQLYTLSATQCMRDEYSCCFFIVFVVFLWGYS